MNKRIITLDALKVFFILSLFFAHSNWVPFSFDAGARIVEFFFLVSGFCFAYKHYSDNIIGTYKESIINVWKKIVYFYPLHFITALFCLILSLFAKEQNLIPKVLCNLLLIQSWSCNPEIFFSLNAVSWYLSALLFCYFCAPLFLKLILNKNRLLFFFLALALRIFIELFQKISNITFLPVNMHVSPPIRALEFFIGMSMIMPYQIITKKIELLSPKICKALFSILEVFVFFILIFSFYKFDKVHFRGFFIILYCPFLIVFALEKGIIGKLLQNKFFKICSQYQLPFYMFHQVVLRFGDFFSRKYPDITTYFMYRGGLLLATILLAIFWKKIENQSKRIRGIR